MGVKFLRKCSSRSKLFPVREGWYSREGSTENQKLVFVCKNGGKTWRSTHFTLNFFVNPFHFELFCKTQQQFLLLLLLLLEKNKGRHLFSASTLLLVDVQYLTIKQHSHHRNHFHNDLLTPSKASLPYANTQVRIEI